MGRGRLRVYADAYDVMAIVGARFTGLVWAVS